MKYLIYIFITVCFLPSCSREEIHKPSSQEITQIFDFQKDTTLNVEDKNIEKTNNEYGNFIWEREYSNPERSRYYITIALAKGGSYLSSPKGRQVAGITNTIASTNAHVLWQLDDKYIASTLNSVTTDGRTIHNYISGHSQDGISLTKVLTSQDKKYDLFVSMLVNYGRCTTEEEIKYNTVFPQKLINDVIEELERIIYN